MTQPETAKESRKLMSWLKRNNLARMKNTVGRLTLLAVVTAVSFIPRSAAQAMQKGISVKLAPTSSAVPVPDADQQDALIITVTDTGKLYFGIDPVMPDALAEKLEAGSSHHTQTLYIKADARAPYASVLKVLDAAHTAGVAGVTLLTTQLKTRQSGTVVPPEGIEIDLARRLTPATK
jgi:biopolymer transport protein ExbD